MFKDKAGRHYFNLNTSIYFDFDKNDLSKHVLTHNAHWPLISYEIYGTTRLAWVLYKVNGITAENIFEMKHAGDTVYYIPKETAQSIVLGINT